MKKLFIVLAICGFFAVATPALAADGTVSGTVTHAADGTPIASLTVSALNVDTKVYSYAATDASGYYAFSLAPGTYDISSWTYISAEANIYFIKKTLTITVASGEVKPANNIALVRRGRLTGHVYVAGSTTPISDATITATNSTGSSYGSSYMVTASDGSFLGSPTPTDTTLSAAGTYTFVISKTGYFTSSVSGVLLASDEASSTQNITLTPASTVSGTVLDKNGAAISGATVTLTKTSSTYSAISNASGVFSVAIFDTYPYNGTAISDYTVTVSKTGYITQTSTLSVVAEASSLTGNTFSLVSSGTITGTITDSSSTALASATITADDGFGNTYTATSDASGAYSLSSLRASTQYTITATKTNYVGQKIRNIKVTAGATVTGKNFKLPAGKIYSGAITAKSGGATLENAVIYLYKLNKTRSEVADFSYTTKTNGVFSFQNVSPGNYRIKVVKTGYITILQDSVAIKSNLTNKAYKLDLGGSIYGQIYTGNKTGVASVDIAVYSVNNGKTVSYTATTTDENGYYSITGLKNGKYRLRISSASYVTKITDVTVKVGTQSTANIKLAAAGSISGYVTDKVTGLPTTALVKVVGTSIIAWADSNGYYVLDGIAPGKCKVTAINAYYDVPGQQTVSVTVNKIKADVNFSLMPKQ
jgi:large repetitive protein